MRRLYSTFAGGLPGIGLFLMRLVVGLILVGGTATTVLTSTPSTAAVILSVFLAVAGILLIVGLCTPIAGTIVALLEIGGLTIAPAEKLVCLLLATFGAALTMLGPGLWSIDARLFGWKRIEPTPRKR